MALDLFNLTGKVALVTGGSKGLGKAMARGLAEAGADILISSRHENELRTALDDILRGTGRQGRFVVADMSRREEVVRLARTALEQMGRVDILINNAGTNKPQAIDEISDEVWDEVLEINLNSVMVLTRALVPQMKARRWGRIIHISSIQGFISKEKRNIYSATKSALLGLARAAPSTSAPSVSPLTASPPALSSLTCRRRYCRRRKRRSLPIAPPWAVGAIRASWSAPPCCWPATPAATSPDKHSSSMAASWRGDPSRPMREVRQVCIRHSRFIQAARIAQAVRQAGSALARRGGRR